VTRRRRRVIEVGAVLGRDVHQHAHVLAGAVVVDLARPDIGGREAAVAGVDAQPVAEGGEGPAALGRWHGVDVEGPDGDQDIEGAADPGGMVPGPIQLLHLVSIEPLGHSPTVSLPLAPSAGCRSCST
jgi:hypothetical protein